MTTTRTPGRLVAVLGLPAVLAACVAVLGAAGPAVAATKDVTLGNQGPSPASITVSTGDVVRFVNSDSVPHQVTRTGGPCAFDITVPAGKSASTPAFRSAGTCAYNDTFTFLVAPRTVAGNVVVKAAPAASKSPTPKATATKSAAPKPAPTRTRASATPSATPVGGSGSAGLPGLGVGVGLGRFPTPTPAPGVPRPDIAGPGATAAPAADVDYADRSLVQSSPHRYGLPAALAVVAITGVVSLLVRLLLAEPAARRARDRRTGPVVTVEPGGAGS